VSRLSALQRQVQQHVLAGAPAALARIAGTRSVPARTRLKIYREAYSLRLAEALATSYPVLYKLLGEDQFRWLACAYIDAQPSRHYSVRFFGHRLAAFLATEQQYRETPVLAELARWEWALADVFDARDAAPLTRKTLESLPPDRWPGLRFLFHTAVRVLHTQWNTASIWSALSRDAPPPNPTRSVSRGSWAIWRTGLDLFFAEMQSEEARALRLAMRGESFAGICALPSASSDVDAALWAAGLLGQWIDRGWIINVSPAAAL
jgi:hypothetical protein